MVGLAGKSLSRELSPKEREVEGYILQGLTDPEIANVLKRSVRTINTHASNLATKLGVRCRTEVVAAWFRRNVLRVLSQELRSRPELREQLRGVLVGGLEPCFLQGGQAEMIGDVVLNILEGFDCEKD